MMYRRALAHQVIKARYGDTRTEAVAEVVKKITRVDQL